LRRNVRKHNWRIRSGYVLAGNGKNNNEASEEATPNKFTLTKASDITPEAGGPDDIFGKAKAAGAITGSSEEWGRIRREWNAARIRTVTDSDKT